MIRFALLFALLTGCASFGAQSDKSTAQVIAEVNKTADKLEAALDLAQDKVVPALDLIDAACQVATPKCAPLHEKVAKFHDALDKAQEAVDAYRKFTGDFAAAATALSEVVKLGNEIILAAK